MDGDGDTGVAERDRPGILESKGAREEWSKGQFAVLSLQHRQIIVRSLQFAVRTMSM